MKILQKAGKWNKVPLPPEDEVKALMRQEVSRMLLAFVLFCVCVKGEDWVCVMVLEVVLRGSCLPYLSYHNIS